jgi:hypothetical protein
MGMSVEYRWMTKVVRAKSCTSKLRIEGKMNQNINSSLLYDCHEQAELHRCGECDGG